MREFETGRGTKHRFDSDNCPTFYDGCNCPRWWERSFPLYVIKRWTVDLVGDAYNAVRLPRWFRTRGTRWEPWRYPWLDPAVVGWTRLTYCRKYGHKPGFDSPRYCKNCGKDL